MVIFHSYVSLPEGIECHSISQGNIHQQTHIQCWFPPRGITNHRSFPSMEASFLRDSGGIIIHVPCLGHPYHIWGHLRHLKTSFACAHGRIEGDAIGLPQLRGKARMDQYCTMGVTSKTCSRKLDELSSQRTLHCPSAPWCWNIYPYLSMFTTMFFGKCIVHGASGIQE